MSQPSNFILPPIPKGCLYFKKYIWKAESEYTNKDLGTQSNAMAMVRSQVTHFVARGIAELRFWMDFCMSRIHHDLDSVGILS
jgi:hypothetical protein